MAEEGVLIEQTFIQRHTGYDYSFVNTPESKYECSICLLVLRSPMQTSCGHRFCQDCIYNWLSKQSKNCPIDNIEIGDNGLFHDACIEREVLQQTVHCPNHSLGCKLTTELKYIEDHVHACQYQPIPCPNNCSMTILTRELDEHLSELCILRPMICKLCQLTYVFNEEQLHELSCSQAQTTCYLCGLVVVRSALISHMADLCPSVTVSCTFRDHGCLFKAQRKDLKDHINSNTGYHLQLLSNAYKKINTFVQDLSRTVGVISSPSGIFSRQSSFRSHQLTGNLEMVNGFNGLAFPERDNLNDSFGGVGAVGGPLCTSSLTSEGGEDADGIGGEGNVGDGKDGKRVYRPLLKLDIKGSVNDGNSDVMEGEKDLKGYQKAEEEQHKGLIKDLCSKNADFNQHLLEESIKSNNLARSLRQLEVNLRSIAMDIAYRQCNGEFVWSVADFGDFMNHIRVKDKVEYSPPFYSSPTGYKFCLRINLTWSADEQEFLALHIHLMKGDNDCFLSWPFQGVITLCLLDCSDSGTKHHITEILEIEKDLMAFRRTHTEKNSKGYGFKQFISVKEIFDMTTANFVTGNILRIKAIVKPK